MGIAPRDELEGMMAAQLVAAHNAAMECYRRAMIGEQSFEGRSENLNSGQQAGSHLHDAFGGLEPASRQRPAKGHGRARPRPRRRAGNCRRSRAGVGWPKENPMQEQSPMHLTPRCGARTRSGSPCRSPAMPNGRCRMHGGLSPGAPKGERNGNYRHGRFTSEAIAAVESSPPG